MTCTEVMYHPAYTPYSSYLAYQKPYDTYKKFAALHKVYDSSHSPMDAINYSTTATTGLSFGLVGKEEESDEDLHPKASQYLSAKCAVYTFFTGDPSSNVDDHFSKSLSLYNQRINQVGGGDGKAVNWKEVSTMGQRNLPPSFWNSAYQPPVLPHPLGGSGAAAYPDPYSIPGSSFHGMAGLQDPWHYSFSSQTHTYPHRPSMHDFTYSSMTPGPSRLTPHYSSLLMQQSMRASGRFSGMHASGTCDLTKPAAAAAEAAAWGSRYHTDPLATTDLSSHHTVPHPHPHLEPAVTGLDGTVQESGKEVYWF
ncbi:transcription cofactor vestigial-like protein 2 isoform X1 [Lingula anatina]|uniref:Transcription cofactor vestigial-like protein 2 n=1 Tax=Lingula anatina TaxID=7574 RepID=A0A1S3JH60_LINAN|nr:transcription cofactor vestigial-like protein 2 [Lingula anatina]XP_013421495.1 transcription cofactor vestigial-like protein 2 isoform X1 [Lingula anatina]|eukprot:XP_013409476.1 transcription cofactor vestigial-like protein 2 [Lingula anatina]